MCATGLPIRREEMRLNLPEQTMQERRSGQLAPSIQRAGRPHFSQTLWLHEGDSDMHLCSHKKDVAAAALWSDTLIWLHESFLYLPLLCCWASKFSHCLSLFQHCLTMTLHLLFPIRDILYSFNLSPYSYLPCVPSSLILSMFYPSPLILFFLFPCLPPLLLQRKFPRESLPLKTNFHPFLSCHLSTRRNSPLI